MNKLSLFSLLFLLSPYLNGNNFTENELRIFCKHAQEQQLLENSESNFLKEHTPALVRHIANEPELCGSIRYALISARYNILEKNTITQILSMLLPKRTSGDLQDHTRLSHQSIHGESSTPTGVLELYFDFMEQQNDTK